MRKLALLTTMLLLSLGGSSEAACQFDLAKFFFGFDNIVKGEADSGKPCGFGVSTSGGADAGAFRIAQPPHHGVAAAGEDSGLPVIGYRSAAGYRGPDEFVMVFIGGNARVPGQTTTVHVYVDVK